VKELLRVVAMTALVVGLMLVTAAWAGATFSSEAPAPQHLPSATPGPDPVRGPHP
jgi:hypothetical protein